MLVALLLCCAAQFHFPMDILETGVWVSRLVVEDIDRDGRPDVVISSNVFAGPLVTVFRGDGWGGFGPGEAHDVLLQPGALQAADLDGDDWPDVVTTGPLADRVSVLRGDGAGGLLPQETWGVGDRPEGVALGDVDGDGLRDILVVNRDDDSLSVLLHASPAVFLPAHSVPSGPAPSSVRLADLDGDDVAEAIVAAPDDLFVHSGLGNGNFGPPAEQGFGDDFGRVALGDLDADGLLDLATTVDYHEEIQLSLCDGVGGFGPKTVLAVAAPQDVTRGVLIVDLDEDGHADVVVSAEADSGPEHSTVVLLRGDGTGAVGAPESIDVGGSSSYLLAADVVVDGNLDLLLAPPSLGTILVLPGDGTGGVEHQDSTTNIGSHPGSFDVGDVDGDGALDVALTGLSQPYWKLSLVQGDGAGGFTKSWDELQTDWCPVVRLGDLDEDGDLDFAAALGGPDAVALFAGDGTGEFGDDPAALVAVTAFPLDLVVIDANVDGHLDLATVDYDTLQITLLHGHGDLGFDAPVALAVGAGPEALAAGDIQGDGLPELVAANRVSKSLTLWTPATLKKTGAVVPAGAEQLALGDMDADGRVDAVVSGAGGTLSLLRGNAAGVLQLADTIATGVDALGPHLADVDADGHVDLLHADDDHGTLQLRAGDGNLGFGPPQHVGVGESPWRVRVADLDADGLADLLSTVGQSGSLVATLQQVPGPFHLVPGGAAGAFGAPLLKLVGSLQPLSELTILLQGAAPAAPVTLVVGLDDALAPFKGGVLVPTPSLLVQLPATTAQGTLQLETLWPVGLPAGLSFYLQAWLPDAAAAQGWAGSTGVGALTP